MPRPMSSSRRWFSRTRSAGTAPSAWLDDVHIIPLDHTEVPRNGRSQAHSRTNAGSPRNRIEIEQDKINIDSQKILLNGDKNGLLPTLQAFAELTNHGLAGPVNPIYNGCCGAPDPYFVGGRQRPRPGLPPQFP